MNDIREFIRSGGASTSDSDLLALLREGMLMTAMQDQRGWLREVELALDAYGAEEQRAAALRVRAALEVLAQGLSTSGR